MKDLRMEIDGIKFSSRAAAIIVKNNKMLFQKREKDKYWALPGGAIEINERGADTVTRELFEETGEANAKVIRPLWFVEYFAEFENKKNHQYILGFLVDIPNDSILLNSNQFHGIEKEKDLIYEWVDLDNLLNTPIKPDFLYDKIINMKDEFEYIYQDHN